jgi:DNA-binding NarL/FixJ family response regulator
LQHIKIRHAKLNREMLALEKENLNKELDLKNRELTSKIISLINISEVIDHIILKLTKSGLNFKKENQAQIQELVSSLRMYKKNDIWQEFEQTFITIHPEFYKKLQVDFLDLTNKELRLCAFLKLNMSSKEISNIMHININSVETARTRLRKKLNLTGSDISLYAFIAKY